MPLIVTMYRFKKQNMRKSVVQVLLCISLIILLGLTLTDHRLGKIARLVEVTSDTQLSDADQDSSGLKICLCNCIYQGPGASTPLEKAADIPDYSNSDNIDPTIADLDNSLEQIVATIEPDDNSYNGVSTEIPISQEFGDYADSDSALTDLENDLEAIIDNNKPDDNSYNWVSTEIPFPEEFIDNPDQMIEIFTLRFAAYDLPDNGPDINSEYITDGVGKPYEDKYIIIITIITVYIILHLFW